MTQTEFFELLDKIEHDLKEKLPDVIPPMIYDVTGKVYQLEDLSDVTEIKLDTLAETLTKHLAKLLIDE